MSSTPSVPASAPLRVIMVCTVPTDRSGIPMVMYNLLRNMDLNGMDVTYVAINEPPAEMQAMLAGLGVRLAVIPRKLSNPGAYLRALSQMAKGADVVHVHGNSATMALDLSAAALAGVRVRLPHSHTTSCRMKLIHAFFKPLFHRLSTGRLACSRPAGEWLYGDRPFIVVRNAVETSRFRFSPDARKEVRRRLGIGEQCVIGHVGSLIPVKNHDFLLDVFEVFQKSNPDSRLLLVGDGELLPSLRRKAHDLNIADKVIFCGSVPDPQDYLSAMDLVIMPSLYEGLPLALVEQQANALPILASDVITREADLTGSIRYLPLSLPPSGWAEAAAEALAASRHTPEGSERNIRAITEAGFDIRRVAADLRDYYFSLAAAVRQ